MYCYSLRMCLQLCSWVHPLITHFIPPVFFLFSLERSFIDSYCTFNNYVESLLELHRISNARWLLLSTYRVWIILLRFVSRRFQCMTCSRSLRSLFLCKCVSRARDRWRTPCRGTLNCFLYNIQILWRFFFFPSVFVAEAGAGGVPGGLIKNPSAVTACSLGTRE